MSDWEERPPKTFTMNRGVIGLVLTERSSRDKKYAGEIQIHGCTVQTGTYRGTLPKVQEQIYDNACHLLERALSQLTASTDQES